MSPLTAVQLVEHPEFEHVFWDLKPLKQGKATVAKDRRGGPLQLAYEVHGEGATKLVVRSKLICSARRSSSSTLHHLEHFNYVDIASKAIIGLGGWISTWQRQIKDFGHSRNTNRGHSQKYSILVFDNRGMGDSDKPWTRYSSSEMAKDTIELCDQIGWTLPRQLHVIGHSMGGMIAQEMAFLVPLRLASLTLASTGPRIFNTVGYLENLRNRVNLFIPKNIDRQLEETKRNLFSSAWLNEPDAEGHFPTNGDRFSAQEMAKRRDTQRFTRAGFLLQAIAAGWHYKSADQLRELGDQVGRDRIQVIHGRLDRMITFPHGEILAKQLGGPEEGLTVITIEDRAHALYMEWRKELTKAVAALVEKVEKIGEGE